MTRRGGGAGRGDGPALTRVAARERRVVIWKSLSCIFVKKKLFVVKFGCGKRLLYRGFLSWLYLCVFGPLGGGRRKKDKREKIASTPL